MFDGNQDYLTLGTDKLGNTELFAGSSDRFSVYSVEKATTGTVFSEGSIFLRGQRHSVRIPQ